MNNVKEEQVVGTLLDGKSKESKYIGATFF